MWLAILLFARLAACQMPVHAVHFAPYRIHRENKCSRPIWFQPFYDPTNAQHDVDAFIGPHTKEKDVTFKNGSDGPYALHPGMPRMSTGIRRPVSKHVVEKYSMNFFTHNNLADDTPMMMLDYMALEGSLFFDVWFVNCWNKQEWYDGHYDYPLYCPMAAEKNRGFLLEVQKEEEYAPYDKYRPEMGCWDLYCPLMEMHETAHGFGKKKRCKYAGEQYGEDQQQMAHCQARSDVSDVGWGYPKRTTYYPMTLSLTFCPDEADVRRYNVRRRNLKYDIYYADRGAWDYDDKMNEKIPPPWGKWD